MGLNCMENNPIPHLTSPLKGAEQGKLALMRAGGYPARKTLGSRLRGNDEIYGDIAMSWFQKLLPPKIKRRESDEKKSVPEGLWSKCPSCQAVLYHSDLEKN